MTAPSIADVTLDSFLRPLLTLAEERFDAWVKSEPSAEKSIFWSAYEDFEHFIPTGETEPLYALVSAQTEALEDDAACRVVNQNRALLEHCWRNSGWAIGSVPQNPEDLWDLIDVFLKTRVEEWFNAKYRTVQEN